MARVQECVHHAPKKTATESADAYSSFMHESGKAETLRLLLRTANGLRAVAAETWDANEAGLFLRGALILEARAQALAYDADCPVPDIHTQIDLTC